MMMATSILERAQNGVAAALRDFALAPGEAAGLLAGINASLQSGDGVRAFAYLLIVFIVAAGLEWLFWTYAGPAYRWLLAEDPRRRTDAWRIAGRRIATDAAALTLSVVSMLAVAAIFAWPPGVPDVIVGVAMVTLAARLTAALAGALLAPGNRRLRLVSLGAPDARAWSLALPPLAGVLAAGLVAAEAFEPHAPHLAGAFAVLTALVAGVSLVVVVAVLEKRRPPQRRLLPRPLVAGLWAAVVLLVWLAGEPRWALTVVIVSATLLLEGVARRIVRAAWDLAEASKASAEAAALAQAADAATPSTEPAASVPAAPVLRPRRRALMAALSRDVSIRAARFVVALAGLGACIAVWGLAILSPMDVQSPLERFVSRTLGAVVLVLLADLAWTAVKTWTDALLERVAATPHGDPETGANARLLTLVPMARKAFGATLVGLLAVSLLSIFGIAITPLLAGAGVLGIAVGFGAQTLVRDVLSGVFYLAEDVFRIGDYIEGGSAKGTVERITLRTVALRHQNGPLHFVPYGSLGSVRNNSRDWVIDKFELPLPIEVDSEFVRKLVKKIGQQMLEDPEIGHLIVEPLKTKIYRIEPGVKVFRCKVQTPPGKQFEVRAAAYRRIEAALRENGLRFADSRSQVVLSSAPQGEPLTAANA
ncbi:hypothetical protein GCM10007036_29210 [Alsobacter metallidurans]|uniref:Mechanosensitive ion channel MscS domain-containing protein n=1 Tax=Alsobacter metallidurans TaxID=340221 RepID=A0A917I9J5_9HYPH|nr:mechanosensitive ion channel family protein [Alsobacter metallidurans]GGH23439.1 hypothetical protein GCM10007036_29210 [Alsobacter metallidurans]